MRQNRPAISGQNSLALTTTYRGFADAEKYIVIGVQEHCSIISENDQWIEQLQEHETLSPEIMRDLQKNISKNKTYNVRLGI